MADSEDEVQVYSRLSGEWVEVVKSTRRQTIASRPCHGQLPCSICKRHAQDDTDPTERVRLPQSRFAALLEYEAQSGDKCRTGDDLAYRKARQDSTLLGALWREHYEQCNSSLQDLTDEPCDFGNTPSELPDVVEKYFQIARDAFIWAEQLTEMDFEDYDAQPACEQLKTELNQAIAIAHQSLDRQRAACLAQGLDPEDYRYCC